MKSNNFSFSRINLNTLSIFYSQCDNKGSMYELEVKVSIVSIWIVGMSNNAKCETFYKDLKDLKI